MNKNNLVKYGVITVFITLYLIVSTISMIHSIDFFGLSNSRPMALALATAFEIGQVAALFGILILDKANKFVIWFLFLLLTSMQIMSNVYFSYKYLGDYSQWAELFGLLEEEPIFQKRMLAMISGGVLPIVALGFIKSLVDYLKPTEQIVEVIDNETANESSIITVDSESTEYTPGEKFDSSINIDEELLSINEEPKEAPVKVNPMPRTPGQYNGLKDPIIGAGSLRKK